MEPEKLRPNNLKVTHPAEDAVVQEDSELGATLIFRRPLPVASPPTVPQGDTNSTLVMSPHDLADSLSDVSRALDPQARSSATFQTLPPILSPEREALTPSEGLEPETACFAGRYALQSLVGVGGMGSVYRARDIELDEVVALKLLRRDKINGAGVLARFRQEVRLARRITHRNIARMYDIGDYEGEKFLTMEFVDGDTLASRIAREGALRIEQTLEVALELCEGLGAAHEAGVVHRDLKPENILIQDDGRVVVTDFGIAWPLESHGEGLQGETTVSPTIAGTPAYMAPEQIEEGELDGRVDVYALGLILYEMLTGAQAWKEADVWRLLVMRLMNPPPNPKDVRPEISSELAALVVRLMAREKAERPASVREVAVALRAELHRYLNPTQSHTPGELPAAPFRLSSNLLAKTPGVRSIGILPFRNLGQPDDGYLAEGLSEDLMDSLSMLRQIRVHSRHIMRTYMDFDGDPVALGQTLGVDVILEGSVRRVGERIRVSLRLTCSHDGLQIWTRRYERPLNELLMLGDEAAQELSGLLDAQRAALGRQAPTDPRAIELYLRARQLYHLSFGENNRKAVELFAQAHALAPLDPLIMAGYAMSLSRRYAGSEMTAAQDDLTRSLANRALAMSPHLGEAHMALAWLNLNLGDNVGAAREVRMALHASPGLADAHDLAGRILLELGDYTNGQMMIRTAIAIEPSLTHCQVHVARLLALKGDVDEAIRMIRAFLNVPDTLTSAWLSLSRILLWHGRRDTALQVLPGMNIADFPMKDGIRAIFTLLIDGQETESAMNYLRSAVSRNVKAVRPRSFMRQLLVETYMVTGRYDEAIEQLVGADEDKLLDVAWVEYCPLMDPIRHRPEFASLLERYRLRRTLTMRALEDPARDL